MEEGFIYLLAGLLSIITLIVFFIIPYRIRILWTEVVKIKEKQSEFIKIYLNAETLKGIKDGYLNSSQCLKCGSVYSTDLLYHKWKCPHCELIIAKGYTIIKYKLDGKVESVKTTGYTKNKHKFAEHEILKEL